MARFGPIGRRQLITNLKRLGFTGPYPGRRHEFMIWGDATPIIPNPHGTDIGIGLLSRVLKQAGVSREEWEGLWFASPIMNAVQGGLRGDVLHITASKAERVGP